MILTNSDDSATRIKSLKSLYDLLSTEKFVSNPESDSLIGKIDKCASNRLSDKEQKIRFLAIKTKIILSLHKDISIKPLANLIMD